MPTARKAKPAESSVESKLEDGHYEQLLAAFRQEIAAARAILKEYQQAMRQRAVETVGDDLD